MQQVGKQSQQTREVIYDFAIIGSGIAGASIAYELSKKGKSIIVLEAEDQAAYHTTGRSAAFYMEAYGNDTVRAFTKHSRDFFDRPPEGFSEYPLLKPSGALYIAKASQKDQLLALAKEKGDDIADSKIVDIDFIKNKIDPIDPSISCGFWEPNSMEIDVGTLVNGYLKLAKRNGVNFQNQFPVASMENDNQVWQINSPSRTSIKSKVIINCAGAWADEIATKAGADPVGLQAKKRTISIVSLKNNQTPVDFWPLTIDIDEKFYFKPEGNNLLITPADETPMSPHDAQADEWDIALGIDRVESILNIKINRVERKWAGLRTFAIDKSPVIGFDNKIPNFFWMAGQGGYGIQMAPALASYSAAKVCREKSGIINTFCTIEDAVSPQRFA